MTENAMTLEGMNGKPIYPDQGEVVPADAPEYAKAVQDVFIDRTELNDSEYLHDLSDRIMLIPVMYGTDQHDCERLSAISIQISQIHDAINQAYKWIDDIGEGAADGRERIMSLIDSIPPQQTKGSANE